MFDALDGTGEFIPQVGIVAEIFFVVGVPDDLEIVEYFPCFAVCAGKVIFDEFFLETFEIALVAAC